MKCPGCNLTVPDHILRCDCGYEFVSDSALFVDQEEVARGEKLQKIGLCLIAAGAFFSLCLIIAYSSVAQQINQWEALRQRLHQAFGTENSAMIALAIAAGDAEKTERMRELMEEAMTLENRNREAWRDYDLITFCCYLTSFTAPEYIRVESKFWPGLTAMSLLLIVGGVVYWMGRRKIADDGSATTLRLGD